MIDLDAFIQRWAFAEGGQERANYALFLRELCGVLGVQPPDPASADHSVNDYAFERVVHEPQRDGASSPRRIDLYKRDCFVLEAKQSRQTGGQKVLAGHAAPAENGSAAGARRGGSRWDVLMLNARRQAEDYVRWLPKDHAPPPFVIVCDVGHCFELYANFRRDGKAYDQYPDRNGFRIALEDLRDQGIRDRLAAIFDPVRVKTLDPTARSAAVTREIADRLAAVSKVLEAERAPDGSPRYPATAVAGFLSRCLFTMFAEDVGLLPARSFRDLLQRCETEPEKFSRRLTALWERMDTGGFSEGIDADVRRFNGKFFKERLALPLRRDEIVELRHAAECDWREVEPAIFGTLLEAALDPVERKRLGAHYTPRAYVERLVQATIIDPLRADWDSVKQTAETLHADAMTLGSRDPERDRLLRDARGVIGGFHARLCETRVLDPACGTGNFLYVALELMKRLEGEVIEALEAFGGQEGATFLDKATVDPHGFFGIEINPRAATIAELVLWIGYLQWHFRTRKGVPPEPILKDFRNIRCMDALVDAEIDIERDDAGRPVTVNGIERTIYRNPRRPDWPMAEFIVGNPPFIGGKDLRSRLGDAYAEALWTVTGLNESADFVMSWWHRAAELLTAKGTVLRRFGFVTTNSISQIFQRRVMERHLTAKHPISLVMAIPDHPWTKATKDAAGVRIAMTVAQAGTRPGLLLEVLNEEGLDTDTPEIETRATRGTINSDLTVGVDVSKAKTLRSNLGLASRGVVLHGAGFIITKNMAEHLGLGRRTGLEKHIRVYRNGRDLTRQAREALVIDLFGLRIDEIRQRFPEIYQYLVLEVKEKIVYNANGETCYIGRDWNKRDYRKYNWWLFGENVPDLRKAIHGLLRYIATVETAKHRIFQFLEAAILPDNMLVAIASEDAFHHGVLSSRIHGTWAAFQSGTLVNTPRYTKSLCFDPFPFPDASPIQRDRIRVIAEKLDAHRKDVLSRHPHLTLTGLYNVLERLRAGPVEALTAEERTILDDGLVLILKEHHDALDQAVADAYGWPADLPAEAILERLVALNATRAAEEKRGVVRWLRPDYQAPRLAKATVAGEQVEAELVPATTGTRKPSFPRDPL